MNYFTWTTDKILQCKLSDTGIADDASKKVIRTVSSVSYDVKLP